LKNQYKPSHQDTLRLTGIDWLDAKNAKLSFEKKLLSETKQIAEVWKDAVLRKASEYQIWMAEDIVKSSAMIEWGEKTTVTFDAEAFNIVVTSDNGVSVCLHV
jgi:hypothetical protein